MSTANTKTKDKARLNRRQWVMLFIESLGWAGVNVLGWFFSQYYALVQNVFEYTPAQMGDLVALMASTAAVSYLAGGALADVVKPRYLILVSYLGLTACGVAVLLRPSFAVMQVLAVLLKVFAVGTFIPSMLKYVASLGTHEQSSRIYGYFYMFAALESLIIAPISAYIIAQMGSFIGLASIVAFFSALMLVSMLLHFIWVEKNTDTAETEIRTDKADDGKFDIKMILELMKNPNMWFVMLLGYVTNLPYDLNVYVQPLLESEFGASQSLIVFVASYAHNGTALIFPPIAGIVAAKIGSTPRLTSLSIILAIISSGVLLLIPWEHRYVFLMGAIIFAFKSVFSIGKTARNTLIGESRLPKKARGTVIGLMFAANGVMGTILARAAGYLATVYGNEGYRILFAASLSVFVLGLTGCIFFTKRLEKAKKRDAIEGAPADLMI